MFGFTKQPKRVYLDHAAATPVSAKAAAAMAPYGSLPYANPSAIHREGVAARHIIELAREQLARVLGIRSEGVVFTGSGTESNNLALGGVLEARHKTGVAYGAMEVLTTAIEHPSISRVLAAYQERGVVVRIIPVDETGRIVMTEFEKLLTPQTVLVTVGYVNSEIGTVQPLPGLARMIRSFEKTHDTRVIFHTDAAQAPLWLTCQLVALGVDTLSLDAGKCYGPKGVGVLAMKHGVELAPVLFGGGQEFGLRSGTENTPLIVGAVTALLEAQANWQTERERVTALRDYAIEALQTIEGVVLNGDAKERVANNVNISMRGVDAEFAVISLDAAGFAVSTKSACSGAESGGSHVIRAISGDEARAQSSIRITLGRQTTKAEIDACIKALSTHIKATRIAHATLTRS